MKRFLEKQIKKNHYIIIAISLAVTILLLCIFSEIDSSYDFSSSNNQIHIFETTMADEDMDYSGATTLDLNSMDTCNITSGGKYILTGSFTGTINVDVEDQLVYLLLDEIYVQSKKGPALNVISASKIYISLKENTRNVFIDSSNYEDFIEENACVFSTSDITINGQGSLVVEGYHKDAIHGKDKIRIISGKIEALSKRDGIRGNDGILIKNGDISIQCESTAIHTTKSGKNAKGNIIIQGGNITFVAGEYGLNSASDLLIEGCSINSKSIYDDIYYAGNSFIQEGCLNNE